MKKKLTIHSRCRMPCACENWMRMLAPKMTTMAAAVAAATTSLTMASNFEAPEPSIVRHIRLSSGALPIGCFRYLWLSLTLASSRVAILFFFLQKQQQRKRNKIQGDACWANFFYLVARSVHCFRFFFFSVLASHFRGATFTLNFLFFFCCSSHGRYQRKGTELLEELRRKFLRFFYYLWNDDSTFQLNLNSSVGKCVWRRAVQFWFKWSETYSISSRAPEAMRNRTKVKEKKHYSTWSK